jgi:hypothetical protein
MDTHGLRNETAINEGLYFDYVSICPEDVEACRPWMLTSLAMLLRDVHPQVVSHRGDYGLF